MFSVVLPGRPCLANAVAVEQNKFAFSFSTLPSFSHIVVFLLPGNTLPSGTAAGVYIQFPNSPNFKLLGAIGNEKPSAIFKVNPPRAEGQVNLDTEAMTDEGSLMAGSVVTGDINLGISVEPAADIQAQLAANDSDNSKTALVRRPPTTRALAQRIIKNAFNFISSFAGNAGGNEVIPLKAFQDWWTKFERRIENDPGFLERED
ncbi:MAG: hypothetical protein Q9160_000659 [Pyrenula sp. 1 TL-2023]